MLVIDFETVDPYLDLGLGPGWVYEYHLKENKFKVIGWSVCSIIDNEIGNSIYYQDGIKDLFDLINTHDTLIGHNLPYDLGCLIQLGYPIEELKKKKFYDTKIMAKLYNNQNGSFSLDTLSRQFLPSELQKKKGALVEIVKKHSLLKTKTGKARDPNTSTYIRDAESYAYKNMDKLQEVEPDLMAYYANQDTQATAYLYKLFKEKLNNDLLCEYYSYLAFICSNALRLKGVRISIANLKQAIKVLEPIIDEYRTSILKTLELPADFNLESPDLAKVVHKKGYPLPLTPTGRSSLSSRWIENYEGSDELLLTIKEYRAVNKLHRDFALTILDNMQYTCPDALHGSDYGRVYPELNVLQAVTGRMSASGPNIQQIPNPEKSKYSKLIRSIYVPDEGMEWISCDWSNQEGRWQVHFGRDLGANDLLKKFQSNPNLDLHSDISQIVYDYDKSKVSPEEHKKKRKLAKAINLGLSYGMGLDKLASSLKVDKEEAKRLVDLYNKKLPFLSNLSKMVTETLKQRKYIVFFDGRVFRRESAIINNKTVYFDYKGINALMQGSGASQMYKCLYEAYKAGLNILFPVHDEINIQVLQEDDENNSNISDIECLQVIMENSKAFKCTVPMPIEIKRGKNWGEVE